MSTPSNGSDVSSEPLVFLVDMWKTTIEVQQHFNELEWKIRGLALTVLTTSLGAGALALRENTFIPILSWRFSLASLVFSAGLLLWLAFFFVDSVWYHRLLLGSVKEGVRLEERIGELLEGSGRLTTAIGEASPWSFPSQDARPGKVPKTAWFTLHSRHKLSAFYGIIAALLVALALGAHLGADSLPTDRSGPRATVETSGP